MELWDGHLEPMKTNEAGFKAVRRKFDDAGITVSAYCVNFPATPPTSTSTARSRAPACWARA